MSTSIAGLLAEKNRRLVAAAVMLGAETYQAVIDSTHLDGRDVTVALDRLLSNGLIAVEGDLITLVVERIEAEARVKQTPEPGVAITGDDPEQASVVRSFFRNGRLTQIPMQAKKRRVVFDILAQSFEPGQLYSEARVNLELGKVHADTATLRRGMVDEGFLGRRDGFYWRAGGTFDVAADGEAADDEAVDGEAVDGEASRIAESAVPESVDPRS
jgi:hypothetical protein